MAWLFQGNPKLFNMDDYLARYPELLYWRTPTLTKKICVGDRVFLWRSGADAGAVAIGDVVESPCPGKDVLHPEALGSELWRGNPPDAAEQRTGIRLHEVRLLASEEMVSRSVVMADPAFSTCQLIKSGQGTVFQLNEQQTTVLGNLWGLTTASTFSLASGVSEGTQNLRAHFVRERSAKLRADKIQHFRHDHGRLFCELCGTGERDHYSAPFAERIFEIHHREPLASATSPVCTTLEGLAVLCASCHRAVHASAEVSENFAAIKDHFDKRSCE